jgi:predicted Zn finger-like uncharacterized protein
MRITCPECGYSREVSDDKIPSKSVRATCPKCGAKFRFRDEEPHFDIETPAEQEAQGPTPEAAREAATEHAPESAERIAERREAEKEDELSGALSDQEPEAEPESEPESEPEPGAEPRPRPKRVVMEEEPSDEDIWQRLENMGAETRDRESRGSRMSFAEQEFESEEEVREAEVPWERLDVYGFFGGLYHTVKRAMLAPGLFFGAMPVGRGLGMPLVFFILISEFQAICQLGWTYLGVDPMMSIGNQSPGMEAPEVAFGAGSLLILLVYPVLFMLWLFIMSGVMHLLLKIFGAGSAGYEGTFRVLSYANAPSVLALIPSVGAFVGGFWSLAIMFIGLKMIHATNFLRVLFALLLPLVVFLALAASIAFMQPGSAPNMY